MLLQNIQPHYESRFRKRLSNNITKIVEHLDWPLLVGIIALCVIGLFILYSAKKDIDMVYRQMFRIILAFGVMVIFAQIPPRFFKKVAYWLYPFSILLLLAVLVMGNTSKGGQRWLDIAIFKFQPAELMKLALPLLLARYLDESHLPPNFKTLLLSLVIIGIPFVLIAKQPDLGTAILILSSGVFVLFFSGIRWGIIAGFFTITCGSLPILWYFMWDYQRNRVLTLFDPTSDPLGKGYHIIQSKIAIGSGGIFGKGWLNGTQSQLEYLPERATDSIFAVFGEEFGLIGCALLLLLYLYVMIRGLYISTQAQDSFCRLLSGSLIMTFFVYLFVNIGMVMGILPVVGIPLPLVSYGGTSLITLMLSFGILMSIHTHRTLLDK